MPNELTKYTEQKFLEVAKKFTTGEGGIAIAPNYDVNAATKDLFLKVLDVKDKSGRPALDVVTPQSIEKSIRTMIIKGLNPIKNQCYPIVRGNQLQIQAGAFGNKRAMYSSNRDVVKGSMRSQVIYQGDTFEDKIMPDGRRELVKHTQPPFGKRSKEIIGAYAIVTYKNKKTDMDVMTIDEIRASWAKSQSGGTVHKEFPHEMAVKTVESRFAKKLYSSTDEADPNTEDYIAKIKAEAQEVTYDMVDDSEPTYKDTEVIDAEPVFEEEDGLPPLADISEDDADEPEDNDSEGEGIEVSYADWKNKWLPTGEWQQVKDSYDRAKKVVRIVRVEK